MFPSLIFSDNSEAQHSSISIYIPSAGRSFMWNFFVDLQRTSDLVLSKLLWLFGHLLFGFRFPGEIFVFPDLRVDQWFPRSWIMIPICWMLLFGIMMDFFKQPPASVQIEAVFIFELFQFFWLFRQILFTSVPLYYFDLKSDWLPFEAFAFGSPPEDLLFRYLLFVTIR